MANVISVRLDQRAETALRILESSGMTRSEAIRTSLIASAKRLGRHPAIAAEVAELEADQSDRAEMLVVAGLMTALREAPGRTAAGHERVRGESP